MKLRAAGMLVFLLLQSSPTLTQQQAPPQPQKASIEGMIVRLRFGEPIAARVILARAAITPGEQLAPIQPIPLTTK